MFRRFLFYLKWKNLPLDNPKVPALFTKSASISLLLPPSSVPCFSVLFLSSVCMVSYAVGVQRKGLILCMKFMDSFLQGAMIWFAVSVIKADNLKDASNRIAFSSKHTRGDKILWKSCRFGCCFPFILKIAIFCFKSMKLLLIKLRR